MELALQYSWFLPVAIGIAGVLYFAFKDLGQQPDVTPHSKTKD